MKIGRTRLSETGSTRDPSQIERQMTMIYTICKSEVDTHTMVITQRESQATIFTAGSSKAPLEGTAPSSGKNIPETYILSGHSHPGQWGTDAVKDGEVFLMELDFKWTASLYAMRRFGMRKAMCSGKAPFSLTQSQSIRELLIFWRFWKFYPFAVESIQRCNISRYSKFFPPWVTGISKSSSMYGYTLFKV